MEYKGEGGLLVGEPINRRIYFFKTSVHHPDKTVANQFDVKEICKQIDQFAFSTGERYMNTRNGEISVWPDYRHSERVKLKIGTVRRSGLPHTEEEGKIEPLDLRDTQGLVEQTHVVFFPHGIVGAEFNFYGPRVSSLAAYINKRCFSRGKNVNFNMLINSDANQQLKEVGDIRLIQVRMKREYLDLLNEASPSLRDSLRMMSEQLDAPILEFGLRNEARSEKALGVKAFDFVRRLVGHKQFREGVDVLKIRGYHNTNERVEEFDLLKDFLVSRKSIVAQDGRHRTVNSSSMYGAIEEAYNELEDYLLDAAGLEVVRGGK